MSIVAHTVTRALVQGAGHSTLRARCSCGIFVVDAPRLSTASRRRQDRLVREHMASVALLIDGEIEAPL